LAVLSGCTPTPAPAPTVTVTSTVTASPTASPTTEPAPAPSPTGATPTLSGTAFNFDCSALDALGTATTVDPNYTTARQWSPTPGTSAAAISGIDGVDCAWVTPDATLVIGLALPDAATSVYYQEQLSASSEPVSGFGANPTPGYFTVTDGVGEADVFTTAGYWVSISAPQFATANDVGPTLAAVLQTLPAG
ncbi:MAG: hypothetical protein Q7T71_11930, partial [Herbiconiux sp.]|nr:hypothetical protein [Herbiconiux sp.]